MEERKPKEKLKDSSISTKKLLQKSWNRLLSASLLLGVVKSLKYPRSAKLPSAEFYWVSINEMQNHQNLQALVIRNSAKSFLAVDFNDPSKSHLVLPKNLSKTLNWNIYSAAYISENLIFTLNYDFDKRRNTWSIFRFTRSGGVIQQTELVQAQGYLKITEAQSVKVETLELKKGSGERLILFLRGSFTWRGTKEIRTCFGAMDREAPSSTLIPEYTSMTPFSPETKKEST